VSQTHATINAEMCTVMSHFATASAWGGFVHHTPNSDFPLDLILSGT